MNTPDGWIKMTERKPSKKDGAIWAYYSDGSITTFEDVCIELGATHWKPAVLPAPPKKELTQREKDEEAAIAWFNTEWPKIVEQYKNALYAPAPFTVPAVWHAALAYRDKQNAEDLAVLHSKPMYFDGNKNIQQAVTNLRRRCGLDQ